MRFTSTERPILVVIGPSGAGKSSVIRRLVTEGLIIINPSWTTRPMRPDEQEARSHEHIFVSEQAFKEKEAAGYFLETAALFGLPYQYGLPAVQAGTSSHISTVMLRASLMPLFMKHYTQFIVYQIVDSRDRVAKRLKDREKAGEPTGTRLKDYDSEIALGDNYANRTFVNDGDIDRLSAQIRKAISEDFGV